MSLAFQNSECIKQAVLEELQNLLSPDTNVIHSAEQRIKQLEFTEGYGVYLSELIMNQSFNLPLRQIASIMLRRYVENHWFKIGTESNASDTECIATEQAKRTIRNILPNGLYDPNSKIRSSVAHTITTIAFTDYPAIWSELFDIIIKCLGGNEDSIHGAMQILQEFSYDENQIKNLGPIIISEVFRIFESEKTYSIATRTSAIKTLKTLCIAINSSLYTKQERASMMTSILNNFMDKLMHYLSMNSADGSNFYLRTEIVKFLTVLTSEMTKHLDPYMDRILPVIWQLLTQIADTYVKVIVNQTEPNPFPVTDAIEDDEITSFQAMLIQIFEFIQCILTNGKIRSTVNSVLTDLIYIVIVYIQAPEELIEDWNDDAEKFVEEDEEPGIELTPRVSGIDILQILNEELESKCLPALQEALGRHMNVAEAEKNAGNPYWWKIQEACLTAVKSFSDTILDAENEFDLVNYLTFARNLLNYRECPYLVGRALWTLSTYSKSDLYNLQMLDEILTVTLQNLSDNFENLSIILKISAVRAINGFVYAHEHTEGEKRNLILQKLPGFVTGIINTVPGCRSRILGLLLDTLTVIVTFDPTFTGSIQNKLIPLTIAVFLKFPEDPHILETIQHMIKALSQNPSCLGQLQEKFTPTIVSILSLKDDTMVDTKKDIALEVLTTIVKNSTAPLPNTLVDNAFSAMIQCVLHTDDTSVMVAGGECLRAFIFISPDQICTYQNGKGLNYIMEVATMLLNPKNSEATAGQIGRLIITIITKLGNMLGENIDMLLKAVISKMQLVENLRVVMSLVVVFAHLFLEQMEAVLNFLSTVPGPTGQPAMQFVFDNWLCRQNAFFGLYERKVTALALCKIFEYGVYTQDNRLTSISIKETITIDDDDDDNEPQRRTRSKTGNQQTVSVPILVKIFSLLIMELSYLQEAKTVLYCSESEEEDGEANDQIDDESENVSPTRKSQCYLSDLYFADEDEENSEDDYLLKERMNDPLFQTNMEENLTKFFQNFSSNEHFAMFFNHCNRLEKRVLESINIKLT